MLAWTCFDKLAFWGQESWGSWGYETRAKKLLKGELKRRGITYAGQLLQWLEAIRASCLRLQD